jgi:hypothetical protein
LRRATPLLLLRPPMSLAIESLGRPSLRPGVVVVQRLLFVMDVKPLPRMMVVVGVAALAVAGCGADLLQAGKDGGSAGADSGPWIAACDHYFAAEYLRCGGPRLPPDENARVQARFEQVCANEIALPGTGVTSATLEACASALDVAPCELPFGLPEACNFKGSRSGGAACTDGLQCASGQCQDHVPISPEGPTGPATCGTCEAAVALGEVCGDAGCSTGICLTTDTTASLPTYSCTAISQGDAGAPCDDLAALCKPGLYCAAQTGTCTELGAMGAPCGDGSTPPGAPGGCLAPLACVGLPGASVCAGGAAGAFCLGDSDCNSGLGCVPAGPCASNGQTARFGCSQSGQCTSITWAGPGQPCSDAVRCLVGTCAFGAGFTSMDQDADGGLIVGSCPMVVPDGQPCSVGTTCDTFSECFAGKCELLDGVVCK